MGNIYPSSLSISHPGGSISGIIDLNRSKSISNRVLIIKALCDEDIEIRHLSESDDSQTLEHLLFHNKNDEYDCHHAGTTFRFLCSYFAMKENTQILTGSERMKERPIGALVEALRSIGADIEYLGEEGFPPLKINPVTDNISNEVKVPGDISSQYISSLMMIGPTLPGGLTINLEGELVSKPYLEMTASMMAYFGVDISWEPRSIIISESSYRGRPFTVEADWSAASYYYAIAASSQDAKITINGLLSDSLQGDSKVSTMMEKFGVHTSFTNEGIVVTKVGDPSPYFEYDFIEQPDLAQTVSVLCGGLGISGLFSGLKTLRIKETDRIAALQSELGKYQVYLSEVPKRFAKNADHKYYMQEGKAVENKDAIIQTYKDHRMAMAFAPLATLFPITIDNPGVVSKSYPKYWEDLESLGFIIKK